MFKALDKNRNSEIRPEDYNEDIHKSNLCCPDPNCTATVHFVSESARVDGSQTARSAHFATDPGEKHHPSCDVLIYESACHQAVTSLESGGYVLFSLNSIPKNATKRFNESARGNLVSGVLDCKGDWLQANKDHKTVSIKHVGDLVRILDHIKEKHGDDALNRCGFNSGGYFIPYHEFDFRGRPEKLEERYKAMLRQDRGAVLSRVGRGNEWVFGAPCLISVSDLRRSGRNLHGANQTISTNWGDRTLSHVIKPKSLDEKETRYKLLHDRDCILTASPHFNIGQEKSALRNNRPSTMGWSLHANSQFVTSSPTPPLDEPPLEVSDNGQLGWKFAQG